MLMWTLPLVRCLDRILPSSDRAPVIERLIWRSICRDQQLIPLYGGLPSASQRLQLAGNGFKPRFSVSAVTWTAAARSTARPESARARRSPATTAVSRVSTCRKTRRAPGSSSLTTASRGRQLAREHRPHDVAERDRENDVVADRAHSSAVGMRQRASSNIVVAAIITASASTSIQNVGATIGIPVRYLRIRCVPAPAAAAVSISSVPAGRPPARSARRRAAARCRSLRRARQPSAAPAAVR